MTEGAQVKIAIALTDPAERAEIAQMLHAGGYQVSTMPYDRSMREALYMDPPQCLFVEHKYGDQFVAEMLRDLRSDTLYGHLPVVLLTTREDIERTMNWSVISADDYMVRPVVQYELSARLELCLARARRDIDANPLTGLPGNLTIMREAERRIANQEAFAIAYLDVDNFKSFNDKYGFARGDEVLRMAARIIVNSVRSLECEGTYVGHIGGDDFVFMLPTAQATRACKKIIQDFDAIVPNFYDEDDRRRGHIESKDRRGNPQTFPLMTVSVAVVDTQATDVVHLADLVARAAEVKHYAKQQSGSNYIIDRRR